MRTTVTVADDATQVLLVPESETDVQAIRLLCILPGAALVRRVVRVKNMAEKKVCLLIRMEEAKAQAEIEFDPETNAVLPPGE
jgi:hypothetical protein